MSKGHHLSLIEGIYIYIYIYEKGYMYLFREKWYIKGKGLDFLEFFQVLILVCMNFSSVLACTKCFCFLHPSPSFNCFNCPFLRQQAKDEKITYTQPVFFVLLAPWTIFAWVRRNEPTTKEKICKMQSWSDRLKRKQ